MHSYAILATFSAVLTGASVIYEDIIAAAIWGFNTGLWLALFLNRAETRTPHIEEHEG